jgi:LacI family transcriptional regulator
MSSVSHTARHPTILDVARLAGVSKSTVSNVIRSFEGVTDETRHAVILAIKQLGYRPNAIARDLARQRTQLFGTVVGDLNNPFHAEMAKLVERESAARGYATMFTNTLGDGAAEAAGIEMMLEHRVAGVVFLAFSARDRPLRSGLRGRVPVVFVGCSEPWADSVVAADRRGARLATEHLIALGHRRIAFLANALVEEHGSRSRLAGYRDALDRAGLRPGPSLRWGEDGPVATVVGKPVLLSELLRGRSRVTAIFSSNDFGAVELLDFADRSGIGVPAELSIVGFDGAAVTGLRRVAITTVAQPKEQLVRLGTEALVARIDGRSTGRPRRRVVDVELIVRRSTAVPPGARRQPRR